MISRKDRKRSSHRMLWASTRGALALLLVMGMAGCDELIEVENPNNVSEDDLGEATAASPLVSGLVARVSFAYGGTLLVQSAAADELTWVGSRDAWQQLDFGNVSDPLNEFTDTGCPIPSWLRSAGSATS